MRANSIERTKIDAWTLLASLYFSLFVSIVRASWITNVGDFLLRNERPTYSYPRHAFNRATFNPAPDRVNRLYCITRRWHRGALAACLRLIRTRFFLRRVRVCHVITMLARGPHTRRCVAWSPRGLKLSAMRCRIIRDSSYRHVISPCFETDAFLPVHLSLDNHSSPINFIFYSSAFFWNTATRRGFKI